MNSYNVAESGDGVMGRGFFSQVAMGFLFLYP